ncbi:MAG TPA: outer membrane beta-barrel protein [Candidatus Acidoferrales bacterium]|nr:outer membrane beta-barrel protein [Candidatus Acidoferrales bacterium]
MRTTLKLMLLFAMSGCASEARAQGTVITGVAPVLDGGIGYSYVQARIPSQGNLSMKGILLSASGDLNPHFGVKVEIGYSRSSDAFQTGRVADTLTYMAGPAFYPIRRSRYDIHVHALVGGARVTGVTFENDGTLVRGYVNHLGWTGGAGFQVRISPAMAIRPEVEYVRTSFFNSNVAFQGQTDIRTTVNLIYTFGRRRE